MHRRHSLLPEQEILKNCQALWHSLQAQGQAQPSFPILPFYYSLPLLYCRSYNHTQCADWYLFINTLCCLCYALKRLFCLSIKGFIINQFPHCPLPALYLLCNFIEALYRTPCLIIQCIISHQFTQRTLTCLYILGYFIQITHCILCICNQLHYLVICLRVINQFSYSPLSTLNLLRNTAYIVQCLLCTCIQFIICNKLSESPLSCLHFFSNVIQTGNQFLCIF